MRLAAGNEASGVLAMVVATAFWGATFVVIRDSLGHLDPYALVAARFGVAGLVFAAVMLMRGGRLNRTSLEAGVVTGVLTAGGYLFQAFGLTATSAGSSAFLTCTGTLFAGFFAWPILRQQPQPSLLAGMALAMAGAALLSLRGRFHLGPGELWTLAGALCYAMQIVAVARYIARVEPLALVTVQSLTVPLVLLPFASGAPSQFASLDQSGWLRFGYLVVAGSLVAPLLQVLAQRALPPGRIGLLFALEPVFGLIFALTLGEERFAVRWWWGAGLILLAVVLVEWAAVRRMQRTEH